MDCDFKDKHDRCTIGCRSINIRETDTCPFIFTSESFKTCPCHPEGLTFIFVSRTSKLINELTDNVILTNDPQISMVDNKQKEDEEEIKRLEDEGHTYHCSCRLVWGDGQCECENVEIIKATKLDDSEVKIKEIIST